MRTAVAALILLCWSAVPLPGQSADEATHNELRALRDGLLDAMSKGDIERELTYFHPNAVITWHNAEVSRGRDGIRKYLARMLEGPDKAVESFKADVEVDELTILYGGDTGIAFGSAVEHFRMTSGRTFDLPARWSATMVRDGDKWLIASLHVSDNLFDNPLLAMARKMAWWVGGAGLLIGVAAGYLLGRRRRTA
ncbi:MAG TPA: nuclear transport factor 2 family protein [Thermoanaerobaculia bacterium]|nr:nuclear transport factor 2 family protein [Thermoanaerobaculia bacterium]